MASGSPSAPAGWFRPTGHPARNERAGRTRSPPGRSAPPSRCTVTGFYSYATEEGLIAHSPAVHVRRPRVDYESHAIGLDRNEVGALLVAAGLGPSAEQALIFLLALDRLRVPETIGADIEALGAERGHRTLTTLRKAGRPSPSRWRLSPPASSAASPAVRLRQVDRTTHLAPRLHHRGARRWGAAARRARGRLPRRPAHDYALRPRQSFP